MALQASELSYRRLFEAAQDGILILDFASGRITDVNPLLHNLLFSRFMSPSRGGRTIQLEFKQKPISIREAA